MIGQNEIENSNTLHEEKNKNKKSIEYIIPFSDILVSKIDTFIERFHTSYEILFNELLNNHFSLLFSQIESDDNNLLSFYYFCVDEIFFCNKNLSDESPDKSDLKIKKILFNTSSEISIVIRIICEEIHCEPETFIMKAIQHQWELIGADIEAGYYYIIDDFCNIPRIKQTLEKLLKENSKRKNQIIEKIIEKNEIN